MSVYKSLNEKRNFFLKIATHLALLGLAPSILLSLCSFVDPSLEMEISSKSKSTDISTQVHRASISESEVEERYEELGRTWSVLNEKHSAFIHRRETLEREIRETLVNERKLATATVDSFSVRSTAIALSDAYFAKKLGGSVSSYNIIERTDFEIVDNALQFLELGKKAEKALRGGFLKRSERLTTLAAEALEISHELQLDSMRGGRIPANPYEMPEYRQFSAREQTKIGIQNIEIPTLKLLSYELDSLVHDRKAHTTKWKTLGNRLWGTSDHEELFPAPYQVLIHEMEAQRAVRNKDVITSIQNLRVAQEQQRLWVEYMENYFSRGHQGVLDQEGVEGEEGSMGKFHLSMSEVGD